MLGLFALVAYRVGLLTTALVGSIGLMFRQPWGRYLAALGLVYVVVQQDYDLWQMVNTEIFLAIEYPLMYVAYYGSVNIMVFCMLALIFHPVLLNGRSSVPRFLGHVLPVYLVIGVLSSWAVFLLTYRLDNTGWQTMVTAVDMGQVKVALKVFSAALFIGCFALFKRWDMASKWILGIYSVIALFYLTYQLRQQSNIMSIALPPSYPPFGSFLGRFFPVLGLHIFTVLVPHSKDLYHMDNALSAGSDVLDDEIRAS